MQVVEGTVESITFQNEDNGYAIAKIKEENGDVTTFVGVIPFITEGLHLKLEGNYIVHEKFGKQFKVDSCEEVVPTSVVGIEKYLSSGVINGIGPVTARKIIEKFKEQTLDILDNDIDRLKEIEGIGKKKIETIKKSLGHGMAVRKINVFLQTYGISPKQCSKIYKKYGAEAIEMVKENPYRLTDDIVGIGFKSADKIARSIGVDPKSPFRIKSGIVFALNEHCAMGNSCMPIDELINKSIEFLNVSQEEIEINLMDAGLDMKIKIEEVDKKVYAYPIALYYSELSVTHKIITLATAEFKEINIDVNKEIKNFEKENKIEFQKIQLEAIQGAFENGIEVITGGPGTGKTTLINCIKSIFEDNGFKVFMTAPTGRAAKRMSEATGAEARTIHRLLEMGVNDDDKMGFYRNEDKPIECDVLIIDESSMIDINLMSSLLKSIDMGTRVIIVGDVDQLPSVGPGNVLRDIIESSVVKVIRLKEIFRQGKESMIVINAHKINCGDMPSLNVKGKDFFFLNNRNDESSLEEILELVNKRLPKFNKEWDNKKDFQILTPMKKGTLGSLNLNTSIQNVLNPYHSMKKEIEIRGNVFRIGDKVMQTKNNYSLKWTRLKGYGDREGEGVYNGDIGFIKDIDEENSSLVVVFDDEKIAKYDENALEELELAYSMTIHKSQGSEFPVVIMPVFNGNPMLMNRNLLYTGVTRAKRLLVLVGNTRALKFMVDNIRTSQRYSTLGKRIKSVIED